MSSSSSGSRVGEKKEKKNWGAAFFALLNRFGDVVYEQPVGEVDELAFSGGEQRSSAGPEGDPEGVQSAL